jgi:hypothetical protein
MAIISVPNIGHMTSRLGFFLSGYYALYPSPSIDPKKAGSTNGHISPLAIQYWDYGLRLAGFNSIRLFSDRTKRGASVLAFLTYPLTRLATSLKLRRLARDAEMMEETQAVVRQANSWMVLTSRSLIFTVQK